MSASLRSLLAGQEITHSSFKGIYLAQHRYPASGLLPMGDMDILVAEDDLYKAIAVLEPGGYRIGDTYRPYQQQAKHIMLADLHEISLFKPFFSTSRFDIDLHWRVDCLLSEIGSLQL